MPIATPHATPPGPVPIVVATTTLVSATIPATERSNPRLITTIVWPMATKTSGSRWASSVAARSRVIVPGSRAR